MKRKLWSEDDIILAMWEWNESHGAPPKWGDWLHSGESHPASMTVRTHFGSWNKAIEAAGFTPYESIPRIEIDEALAKKLRAEGASNVEIARRLGVSVDVVVARIGRRPPNVRASKNRTREQRIADLREALKEDT